MERALEAGDMKKVCSYLDLLSPVELEAALANHTMRDLPTMHYLARFRFLPESLVYLDQVIKTFVQSGYDINKTTDNYSAKKRAALGFTALLAAVEKGNVPLMDALLRNGAKTNTPDAYGFTPCHWAVLIGSLACLEKLIEFGAPVASTAEERSGKTSVHPILHTAVDEGRADIVSHLILFGLADANEIAIYTGILSERAFTKFPDRYNNKEPLETADVPCTPLGRAIRMRKLLIIELLLKFKVKPGLDELHFLIVEGDTEVACLLVQPVGYFTNEELCGDKISGHWALHCLHPKAFQDETRLEHTEKLICEYLDAGWDVNSVTQSVIRKCTLPRSMEDKEERCVTLKGFTLLHIACLYKGFQIIQYLVKKEGARVNVRTQGEVQLTPLEIALLWNQWGTAAFLLENGADLPEIEGNAEPLLFTLLEVGFEEAVSVLLRTLLQVDHLKVNVRNSKGRNLVEHLLDLKQRRCCGGREPCWRTGPDNNVVELVKLLVHHGVDVSGMEIGADFKYHKEYKSLLQFLCAGGAKIAPSFFEPSPVCHPRFVGTRLFNQEILELKEWKKRFDKENRMSLKHLCRLSIRKSIKTIGDVKKMGQILPRDLIPYLLLRRF